MGENIYKEDRNIPVTDLIPFMAEHKATLQHLSALCRERDIKTFILDLQKNMGGSSAVIDEFIKYTDIDYFRRYEMIDYSSGSPKHITRRADIIPNKKSQICFPPQLFCRISQHTFSSARTFAVTLRDNGIAKIIGTPSGGKPNSFGLPKRYKTPHNGISFRVSSCEFLRPNRYFDSDDSIFLDEFAAT